MKRNVFIGLSLVILSACGGGTNSTPPATAPVAGNSGSSISAVVSCASPVSSIAVSSFQIPAGTATTVRVSIVARDKDGKIISGPGSFVDINGRPLTFTLSAVDETSGGAGRTTLSRTTVTSPTDVVKLSYNGKAMYGSTIAVTASGPLPGGATSGVVTVQPAIIDLTDVGDVATDLTVGSDHKIWYTAHFADRVGSATPGGSYNEYTLPKFPDMIEGITLDPWEIVTGPDGNVWFNFEGFSVTSSSDSGIGRITPGGSISIFRDTGGSMSFPIGLTVGPDGNLWFSQANGFALGSISMSGVITNHPLPAGGGFGAPSRLTTGPDGAIWVAASQFVDRYVIGGTVTAYDVPSTHGPNPYTIDSITPGPDGNIWFTEETLNGGARISKIGRVTMAGAITEFTVPSAYSAFDARPGPDGNVWFIDALDLSVLGTISPTGDLHFYHVVNGERGIDDLIPSNDGNFWITAGYRPAAIGKLVY